MKSSSSPSRPPEHIARDMLRQCAERALWRLSQSEADVETIAEQLKQTAALVQALEK